MATEALLPTACTILLALVLNTDHCLQASITTAKSSLDAAAAAATVPEGATAASRFAATTAVVLVFLIDSAGFFLAFVFAAATGATFLARGEAAAERPEDLVARTMCTLDSFPPENNWVQQVL
jgi:hypothetical protein